MMIAYHRGRMPADNGIKGGLMAATGLSAEEAQQRVQGTPVVLACDNSPSSTTISGQPPHLPVLVGLASLGVLPGFRTGTSAGCCGSNRQHAC